MRHLGANLIDQCGGRILLTVVRDTIAGMQVKVLLGIGNVNDFEDADKLAAYVSIVPRVSQSNETDNRGALPSAATSWCARPSCNTP